MREILFRGKSKHSGEWLYGGYFKHLSRTLYPCGDRIRPKDIKHLIIQSGFSDFGMPRGVRYYEVDPNTVGQWTGLNDSNGAKIFEGDIIGIRWDVSDPCAEKIYRKVSWVGDTWYSTFDINDPARIEDDNALALLVMSDKAAYRVVGNIHDNPELLKGDEA